MKGFVAASSSFWANFYSWRLDQDNIKTGPNAGRFLTIANLILFVSIPIAV